MGMFENGRWLVKRSWASDDGRFKRQTSQFRHWVKTEQDARFQPDEGRYHLYVSLACPWAHRTVIARKLRGLDSAIGLSVVDPFLGEDGWFFSDAPGCIPDTVNGARYLRDIYLKADPQMTGRVTTPVLWDTHEQTIVNNESRDILRMFSTAFLPLGDPRVNLCPEHLRQDIDKALDEIYEPINNGVYRAGFATTQAAYEEAVIPLFESLEKWDGVLARQRFVGGSQLTEADLCLFTTLFRFDPVYHYHFKCNLLRLRDFSNLWGFVRDVYQTPGVAETCNLTHIKQHYFSSHEAINPTRIVPVGPKLDYDEPHGRG